MKSWLRKFMLVPVLVALPLQGIAASFSDLLCLADAPGEHHVQGAPGDGPAEGPQNDRGNAAPHPCSHVTPGVAAHRMPMLERSDSPSPAFPPGSLHDLHCPDRPQRPPLA